MSWYKTGSVTATSGSKIITGTGTQFTNPLNGISAGRMLLLPDAGTVQIYEIESVQSDTQLTLVSVFSGTTGSSKPYAIPTSPTVSIEQFAHEFASTLAYYQQQLQGWQSILTGSGNITLTTPDGQTVTVRSQAEWDRLLNNKIEKGEFGWGGRTQTIVDANHETFFNATRASGVYAIGGDTSITKLPVNDGLIDWKVTIIGDGRVFGILAVGSYFGVSTGNCYIRVYSSASGWSDWFSDWNSKSLYDVWTNRNTTVGSGGALLAASPVINIFSDGSFTANNDAAGVNVERMSEGVYRITGCQGMNSDPAWNGIDGGVKNPVCRNDKALLWNNYEVDEDGSITVYTFHRVHADAMPFAQNRLTLDKEPYDAKKGHKLEETWPDQTPIDVPRGAFIQVRVNMPEREEPKLATSHSNVYSNTISPA